MRNIKHFIWDWNGTLLDDARLCIDIMNGLLAKRRLPLIDTEAYQRDFAFPVVDYYRHVGFDFSCDPFELLSKEYMAQYDRRCFTCSLQPGARQALATLSSRGYSHSVLSATEQSRLEKMVAFAGLREYFTLLTGIDNYYANGKISQGERMLSTLEHATSETMLIGDTLHDYEVAKALGISCLLIPSGHCSRERLASCGARMLNNLDELIACSQ